MSKIKTPIKTPKDFLDAQERKEEAHKAKIQLQAQAVAAAISQSQFANRRKWFKIRRFTKNMTVMAEAVALLYTEGFRIYTKASKKAEYREVELYTSLYSMRKWLIHIEPRK